jgi:peptide/nickel transport system substrate-binding protein
MTGTYDTAICWETGDGPTPYYLYFNEFNPAFSAAKIGEKASSDYSRYTNPLITSALQVFAQTSDLLLQKQAIYTIERIVIEYTRSNVLFLMMFHSFHSLTERIS